ncbi:NADH:flavin oxidoreductase [Desulfoluna butyratoxydans]|uniref:Nadh:flavin oxidoreductase/nadh oxidase n-terminal n=1 Tax=Desulfoluna butyratoxydans TaxID=231438 RepID=A0A4V6IKV5_9BACT|nr:NADH:flavin oxidoreductase [Desulfoluna butyratoxydans]VFQ42518.1 nadh:flavin oxidoreductase/nadh oxidase n-terminal [Desulfoluna butyratoxydans]
MKVFQQGTVGGIEVKNRVFRSATYESMADEGGRVSPAMTEMYTGLAKGEVGLIITGYLCFASSDNPSARTVSMGSDADLSALRALTDAVHGNGGRVVAQLAHVGSQLHGAPSGEVFAPSAVVDPVSGILPTPFSAGQIETLVAEFGEAALRAKRAGFDGVQLHAAHGYLLSRFLSPVYNRRTDAYGGSPEKNARILSDILREIKGVCGPAYPVWVKLNCDDFETRGEGLTFGGMLVAAKALDAGGIDAIELSGGTFAGAWTPCRPMKHESYHLEAGKALAAEVSAPVISVGGFRRIEAIEAALAGEGIEAVSLCRPLIREPGLVKRWRQGDRSKAACVACNGCFNPKGVRCFFDLKGEEREAQKQVMAAMKGKA